VAAHACSFEGRPRREKAAAFNLLFSHRMTVDCAMKAIAGLPSIAEIKSLRLNLRLDGEPAKSDHRLGSGQLRNPSRS
jgi:hypothetical protein